MTIGTGRPCSTPARASIRARDRASSVPEVEGEDAVVVGLLVLLHHEELPAGLDVGAVVAEHRDTVTVSYDRRRRRYRPIGCRSAREEARLGFSLPEQDGEGSGLLGISSHSDAPPEGLSDMKHRFRLDGIGWKNLNDADGHAASRTATGSPSAHQARMRTRCPLEMA
jgi:hypothetical protein